jgi:hypothetical protein
MYFEDNFLITNPNFLNTSLLTTRHSLLSRHCHDCTVQHGHSVEQYRTIHSLGQISSESTRYPAATTSFSVINIAFDECEEVRGDLQYNKASCLWEISLLGLLSGSEIIGSVSHAIYIALLEEIAV